MKICMIIPSNKSCAPNNIALAVAEGAACQHQVTVLYLKTVFDDVIQTERCALRKMQINDFITLHHYDVIHSHLLKPDIINGLFACWGKRRKVKRISTVHSNIRPDLSTYFGDNLFTDLVAKLWFFFLNRLDCRVVVSQSLGDSQCAALKNYLVIHNGIAPLTDTQPCAPEKQAPGNRVALGVLSRLHPGKGIEDALLLAERYPLVDMHIYGAGKLEKICECKMQASQNIYCHGFTHDIRSVFSTIDILLVSSRHEGFGMTLLEAMKYATPVICYDIPVFREILGAGEYYYRSHHELVQLIQSYRAHYREIQQRQRARLSFFYQSRMIKKYHRVYE